MRLSKIMNATFGVMGVVLMVGCGGGAIGGATIGGFCGDGSEGHGSPSLLKLEVHIADYLSGCYKERSGLDAAGNWILRNLTREESLSIPSVAVTGRMYDCSRFSFVDITLNDTLSDGEYELTHSVDGDELTHEFSVSRGKISDGFLSRDTKMPSPCDNFQD